MAFIIETMAQLLVWLRGEMMISAALLLLLLGPGAVCCWLGYHIAGVRLEPAAVSTTRFVRRRQRRDRVEQRLATLSNAISLLTDSTEAGLREALGGLERLAVIAPAAVMTGRDLQKRLQAATSEGQSARDIAIAEGMSEGEARLRLRLQGIDLAHTGLGI
jgi:hypothetical protein